MYVNRIVFINNIKIRFYNKMYTQITNILHTTIYKY